MDTVGISHYICSEEDLVKAIILHNHGPPIKLPSNMPISPHSSLLKLQVTNPNKQWWWISPCWCRWSKTSLFKNSTTEQSPVGGWLKYETYPNIICARILLATINKIQSRFCQYFLEYYGILYSQHHYIYIYIQWLIIQQYPNTIIIYNISPFIEFRIMDDFPPPHPSLEPRRNKPQRKNATVESVERPSIQQVQLQCTERRNLARLRRDAQWETTWASEGAPKIRVLWMSVQKPHENGMRIPVKTTIKVTIYNC